MMISKPFLDIFDPCILGFSPALVSVAAGTRNDLSAVLSCEVTLFDQGHDITNSAGEELYTQSWLAKPRSYRPAEDNQRLQNSVDVVIVRILRGIGRCS